MRMTNSHIQEQIATLEISDATKHSILAAIKQILRYAERQYGYPIASITNCSLQNKSRSIEIMNRTEQAQLMQFLHEDMDISNAGYITIDSNAFSKGRAGICSMHR